MFNRQSLHIALLLWGCIFSLLAAVCIFMIQNYDKEKRRWLLVQQLTCAVLLASDAMAWGWRGVPGQTASVIVHVSNCLVFALTDIVLLWFHGYLCCYLFPGCTVRPHIGRISQRQDDASAGPYPVRRIRAVTGICLLSLALVVVSQFTGFYYYIDAANIYHRSPAYGISAALPILAMLIELTLLVPYRHRVSREIFVAMLSYLVLPLAAAAVQMFFYGISLSNIAISISMILMFLETSIEQNRRAAEQDRKLAQTERELTESRIATMMSQIRNHFIFNTLGAISGYCKIDPAKADEMLTRFARYLRRNMQYLEEKDLIPFTTEIKQIEDYIMLEQMRFPELIEFGENFEVTNFKLPPLTVQPLVENAVKHGLTKPGRKGSICVSTRYEDGCILVEVADDGIGFVTADLDKTGSLGLRNVRYRLEHMARATLTVESTPGQGTQAIIRIPEQQEGTR